MSAKRLRLGRPSSSGDTTIMSAAPIFNPNEVRWLPSSAIENLFRRRKGSSVKNRPVIFTVSPPVLDYDGARNVEPMQFGSFLDKCCYCCKRIAEDEEVFMYSMRAFCTVECREKQINIDNGAQRLSATPKPRKGKHAGGL